MEVIVMEKKVISYSDYLLVIWGQVVNNVLFRLFSF